MSHLRDNNYDGEVWKCDSPLSVSKIFNYLLSAVIAFLYVTRFSALLIKLDRVCSAVLIVCDILRMLVTCDINVKVTYTDSYLMKEHPINSYTKKKQCLGSLFRWHPP